MRIAQHLDDDLVDRLRARKQKLKVVIVYAVLYRFRMPIFRRISADPALDVSILTSKGVPGTKLENAKDLSGVQTRSLLTYVKQVDSTGRSVPLIINPTLIFHLIRERPDVLLIQGGMVPNNLMTLVYAWISRTPIVWWSLGRVRGREFKGLSLWYQRINQWIERQATCYAGYSSESLKYFFERGYNKESCFNLVNVVDTEKVDEEISGSQSKVAALQSELNPHNKKVILFVGSVTDTKKLDTLISAYAQLKHLHETTILLVVGDGPLLKECKQLADSLSVSENVIFTGAVYEGVAAYFQLGDLMVLPGTGGLAISEAMVHGLPVICSVGDGVEVDLIDEGVNGFIVNPGDVAQLAGKIDEVFQSPEKVVAMGGASRNIIETRANIKTYMQAMLSALNYAAETRIK